MATIFVRWVLAAIAHHFRTEEDCRRAARSEVAKRMDAIGSNMYSMLACCDVYLKRCKDHPRSESLSKEQQKLVDESLRFRKADRRAGEVDETGYYMTLAAIAMRAGEGYSYLKNLRSKNCTVNPCRERVIRLAKAIDATPNETDLLLRTAGHAA